LQVFSFGSDYTGADHCSYSCTVQLQLYCRMMRNGDFESSVTKIEAPRRISRRAEARAAREPEAHVRCMLVSRGWCFTAASKHDPNWLCTALSRIESWQDVYITCRHFIRKIITARTIHADPIFDTQRLEAVKKTSADITHT